MTTTNTFICPYCGEEKDRAGDSVEHPMPRALGGHGFSSRGFCNVCNPRAGQEVDRPFVEHFSMVALRHKFGVRDGRGQVPPAPRLPGTTVDGRPIQLELGRKESRIRLLPHKTRDDESGVTYVTEPGQGEGIIEKVKARLEAQLGPGYRVDASVEDTIIPDRGSVPVSISELAWPRFAAKLALAFGRETLGDDWARSNDAMLIRKVLWDTPDAPSARPLWRQSDGTDVFARLAPPPTHLVMVSPTGESGCGIIVQLFGGMVYGCQLSDTLTVAEPRVWTFDPVAGTATETSVGQLIADSAPPAPR
jgi:HNH endonuclease